MTFSEDKVQLSPALTEEVHASRACRVLVVVTLSSQRPQASSMALSQHSDGSLSPHKKVPSTFGWDGVATGAVTWYQHGHMRRKQASHRLSSHSGSSSPGRPCQLGEVAADCVLCRQYPKNEAPLSLAFFRSIYILSPHVRSHAQSALAMPPGSGLQAHLGGRDRSGLGLRA